MSLDDAFNFVDLESDDILDNILHTKESSRKTSPLWNYVDCKSPAHPGVPVCKRCNYIFSIKLSNTTIERHLLNKHNIIIPKILQSISSKVPSLLICGHQTISSEAYLGLTIHYIDQNWVLRRFLLNIIPFKVRHTGINMAAAITNVLNEFNLAGKALALTTDNESAMLVCRWKLSEEFEKELNNLTFSHYHCSAHILNLAVKQGMEIVDQEIVEVRQLMSKIKNSVLLCDELRELCVIEKLEYLRPEIDIETRWNSTYYMLFYNFVKFM
ncbi:hypothetical protein RclHR1_23770001 [Rhizophagus clarus]|uniref:BED-type domain-containing protein n=1 Tax=Rhizophagus clarus TaxID=94130 RepID=A0A2Z6RQS2_9GLOM|nr:hypothetical protein RclHR1_23770001 [Rhizophagus clarus]